MCLSPAGVGSAKAMMLLPLFLVLVVGATRTIASASSSSSSSSSLNSPVQLALAGPTSAMSPAITTTATTSSSSRPSSALRNSGSSWPGANWGAGRLRSPAAAEVVLAGFGSASSIVQNSTRSSSRRRRRSRRMMRSGASSLRCVCAVPPPNISPLAWDVGMSTVVGAASVVWVKLWTTLARQEKLQPQVSRKVVHTTAAPLFMVLWPFFTDRPCARFFAAAVPMMQAVRLARAGRSGDPNNNDASTNALVKAISRSGRASETLGGPLKYSVAIALITALEWRTSVVGIVAMLQMAVGDGMADLVGRKFGKHKWQKGDDKSIEGSAAFASGSFLASMGMIQWFHRFGMLSVIPKEEEN